MPRVKGALIYRLKGESRRVILDPESDFRADAYDFQWCHFYQKSQMGTPLEIHLVV